MKKYFILFLILSLFFPIACKKESPTFPSVPTKNPPIINSFSVNPTEIDYGKSATLSWNVSNATSIFIDQGIGSVSNSGSRTISPEITTTYNLTAINSDGQITRACILTVRRISNVVMIEGPIFQDSYSLFEYKGIVKNIGNADAEWVKIYIYVYNSAGNLLDYEYTYADDYMLAPGESSPWNVLFWDDQKSTRNQMDHSKTTYEIKWD